LTTVGLTHDGEKLFLNSRFIFIFGFYCWIRTTFKILGIIELTMNKTKNTMGEVASSTHTFYHRKRARL